MILFAVAMCQISDLIFLFHFVKGFYFLVLVLVHFDKGTCSSFLRGKKRKSGHFQIFAKNMLFFSFDTMMLFYSTLIKLLMNVIYF